MSLFKNDKLYQQKYSQVKDIISAANSYFNGKNLPKNQQTNSKSKVDLQKWKEEAMANAKIIKSLEDTVLNSRKENITLNKKIERLEDATKNLEYTNLQQNLSTDLVRMLQENQKRVEDDNKYLKDWIKLQKELFAEKEQVWGTELSKLQTFFNEFKNSGSSSNRQSNSYKHVDGNSQSIRKAMIEPRTPDQHTNENDHSEHNSMSKAEYMSMRHPETSSGGSSVSRTNLGRSGLDHMFRESNLMKDSLLKQI